MPHLYEYSFSFTYGGFYRKHVRFAPSMYPSLAGWPLLLLLPGCLIDDVESLFQGCTHVRGDITITDTYSGALILPNLKTIDGKFDVQYITSRPGTGNSTATQVTSLELPDTQSIKSVAIANITTLKTISMTLLESVSHFSIYQHGITTDTLDLRSLREASYFYLAGGFSSAKFPFLKDFESIDIHSTLPVGCKSFTTQMEEISQSLEYKARYRCSEPRSTPSLLGLIALCVIPVITIAAAGYCCTKRKHEDMEYEEEKVVDRPLSSMEEDEYEKVVGQR
ncbi:hypothetical protein BDV33DRAFT_190722 [Aspergillus novoparasiticus]|uniref:Uncharacterized protein n=1 Tax=Aspergillus novoparasiticus TaxID=986946 RepID=A0A5N6EWW2_9EURO|nr:hypothetical protein BDV33DRAFT_190722 [Aspergillus novoparasiticus]